MTTWAFVADIDRKIGTRIKDGISRKTTYKD
jgi:hypothetical protein